MSVKHKRYDIFLKHPFTMIVCGPTGCGKTTWLKKLLNSREFVSKPSVKKVYYFYGEWQDAYREMKDVVFIQGLPDDISSLIDSKEPVWIVIDDLMNESFNSKLVSELFTKSSHHRSISVILVTQNFFAKGKESRNISLNTHYMVLFKNPRDKSTSFTIGRQIFPSSVKKFAAIVGDATKNAHSYIFIDLRSETPDEVRLLTNVLGESKYILSYVM